MSDATGAMLSDEERAQLPQLLAEWIPHQRWFGGKNQPVDSVRVLSATALNPARPQVEHLIVGVQQGGEESVYQVPLSIRPEFEPRLHHVEVGMLGELYVYDALHDKDATALIIEKIEKSEDLETLSFHKLDSADIPVGEPSTALTAEQTNTSLAYGDAALLKVFRRLQAGVNPDVEVHEALTMAGSENIAALLGWVDGSWEDPATGAVVSGSLAMLQKFLTTATDGWQLATTSVRDLYAEADLHAEEVGGDFAGEARRLGQATADVHLFMARTLETGMLSTDDLKAMGNRMRARLQNAASEVPELAAYADGLAPAFEALATIEEPVPAQRIHGDYHLGQVLRTVIGWKLLDFEGEPHEPLAQRVALDSPLRDVAAMLRSFDYAALHLLVADHPGDQQIAYRAHEWSERNADAFCEGYAEVSGSDPREHAVLLRAYETDKAVYEAVWEAHIRPRWLPIPLDALRRLSA